MAAGRLRSFQVDILEIWNIFLIFVTWIIYKKGWI